MKVQLLTSTRYNGPVNKDDIIDVPDTVGKRWIRNHIAILVEEVKVQNENSDDEKPALPQYDEMKPVELYKLCIERGIEAKERQKPEYYIDLLKADDEKVNSDNNQ